MSSEASSSSSRSVIEAIRPGDMQRSADFYPLKFERTLSLGPDVISYHCDGCKERIRGIRHHCIDCEDFDYCSECFRDASSKHPHHSMISQDDSRPPDPVEMYLKPLELGTGISEDQRTDYEHSPLDNAWTNFRLLILHPGQENDIVDCRMVHVPLFCRAVYEALSYTWGPPTTSCTIRVDGKFLSIRENLFKALKALRLAEHPRYLWIDALCINQTDDLEKSLQLQRMRFIYHGASEVIVWLGEHANHSSLAMQLITDFPNAFSTGLIGSDEQYLALHHLTQRQYWNRRWCIQEISSATRDPILVCGSQQVSLRQFYNHCLKLPDFWKKIGMSSLEESIGGITKLGIQRMYAIRKTFLRNGKLDLFHLLSITLSFDATDPRDYIYSLFGLCKQKEREALTPDPSSSARDIYLRLARHWAQQQLNFLAFNTNSSNKTLGRLLPSWVPDWSLRDSRSHTVWTSEKIFHASGETKEVRSKPHVHDVGNPEVLAVTGFAISNIVDTSEAFTSDESWVEPGSKSLRQVVEDVEDMVKRYVYKHADDVCSAKERCEFILNPEKSDQLWRTLIADRRRPHFSFDGPAPPEFAAAFCTIREELELLYEDDELYAWSQETDSWTRRHYISMMMLALHDRRAFATQNGTFGIAYKNAQASDVLAVLFGADIPVILRPKGDGKHFQFISEAFAHGYMYGEVFRKKLQPSIFCLQ